MDRLTSNLVLMCYSREELLVGVVIGAVGVRVRMIDSQPMPLPPQ